jgi:hypothetical protein
MDLDRRSPGVPKHLENGLPDAEGDLVRLGVEIRVYARRSVRSPDDADALLTGSRVAPGADDRAVAITRKRQRCGVRVARPLSPSKRWKARPDVSWLGCTSAGTLGAWSRLARLARRVVAA